jgi:hypothetical protein
LCFDGLFHKILLKIHKFEYDCIKQKAMLAAIAFP